MRRLLALFVVLSVAWSQFAGQTTAADRYGLATPPLESIKFDPDDGLVLIPVRIGARDYQFMLDTGTTGSVFDVGLRSHLGPRVDSVRMTTPDGHQVEMDLYNSPNARVGALPLTKDPVMCHDFTSFREASGCAIYGVAGMDFFKDRIVTIDFDAGRVNVFPPNTESDTTWGASVPFVFDDHGSMRILAKLGEKVEETFIVDTGDSGTGNLSEATLARLVDLHDARVSGTLNYMTFSGSSSQRVARVSRLSLGSYRHENLQFMSAQQNDFGFGYLSRYRLTIDLPNHRLFLAKGKRFADHDHGNTCGLHVLFKAGTPVAESVDAKSPADAAGIRPKDAIVNVSGQPVSKLKASQVRRLLSEEGKPVRLTIQRDGKLMEMSYIQKEHD